jgi:hypothetical protein
MKETIKVRLVLLATKSNAPVIGTLVAAEMLYSSTPKIISSLLF